MKQTWVLALLLLCKTAWVFAQDGKPTDVPQTQRHRRPNVLFIAVDDLNHLVTHLKRNPEARTLNIDRLARMGMTFTKAYCVSPSCEPSRAALMSGKGAKRCRLKPRSRGAVEATE
ncbi:MAG: sulfatase-like hydrolase/transferase [Planctomycetes bacterium]|nr:sulfatase-like hydrolase/transferase [Planctomycetota bacterium]